MLEEKDQTVVVEERNAAGLRVRVRAGGISFVADEPVSAGGLGTGPNPYELLGAALGACTAMTLRLYAARKGWPLEGVDVAVRHEWQDGDLFISEVKLDGPLDATQYARLLQIAGRCPVHHTLTGGARIETRPAAVSDAALPARSGRLR
jgi:putative redox protein